MRLVFLRGVAEWGPVLTYMVRSRRGNNMPNDTKIAFTAKNIKNIDEIRWEPPI